MESSEIKAIRKVLPYFLKHKTLWSSYDEEADVLYLHFKKPNHADESEMVENDIIIRYEKDDLVGLTIFKRQSIWLMSHVNNHLLLRARKLHTSTEQPSTVIQLYFHLFRLFFTGFQPTKHYSETNNFQRATLNNRISGNTYGSETLTY